MTLQSMVVHGTIDWSDGDSLNANLVVYNGGLTWLISSYTVRVYLRLIRIS
jgi:hypothetical protein